jgi:short-subunit dehydrogenase
MVIAKDLSLSTAAEEVYAEIQAKGVQIDVLVNNAGFNVYGPFVETDRQAELRVLQVNLVTPTLLTKLFVRGMVDRGFGRILNVASTASFRAGPARQPLRRDQSIRSELFRSDRGGIERDRRDSHGALPGTHRHGVCPSCWLTDTNIFQGRLGSAKRVAALGYDALMQGKTTAVTGLANKALVWSLRLAPRTTVARVAKGMLTRRRGGMTPSVRHT